MIFSIHKILGLLLAPFPFSFPSTSNLCSPCLRIICPKNCNYLRLIIFNSSCLLSIIFITSLYDLYVVHSIRSILLLIHISNTVIFFAKLFVIVHVSGPCRNFAHIRQFTMRFLVSKPVSINSYMHSRYFNSSIYFLNTFSSSVTICPR